MSCLIARSEDLFDSVVLALAPHRQFQCEPSHAPLSLFDFVATPARRTKLETAVITEEDLERWDGLS